MVQDSTRTQLQRLRTWACVVVPHDDDAIFNLAAVIGQGLLGHPTTVAVVFSASTHDVRPGVDVHLRLVEATEARRMEAIRAFAALDPTIRLVFLDFYDAIDRQPGVSTKALICDVRSALADLIKCLRPRLVLSQQPNGEDQHTDHVVVASAISELEQEIPGVEFSLLGDAPYATSDASIGALSDEWEVWRVPLTRIEVDSKVALLRRVPSQYRARFEVSVRRDPVELLITRCGQRSVLRERIERLGGAVQTARVGVRGNRSVRNLESVPKR